ncbi:MAG: hypothetical protein HUJ73_03845 [Eubacterium sp.]|nr:hypothetical protein [Eubacterium sp.]
MKKKVLLKVLPILVIVVTAFSLAGCKVSTTSTVTKTTTDEKGNTVTTTTVKENGEVKEETTTEVTASEKEAVEEAVEEAAAEEAVEEAAAEEAVEEAASEVIVATITFDNQSGVDIYEMNFSDADSDDWGPDVLGEFAPLENGQELVFENGFTYSAEKLLWDLRAKDSDGNEVEFDGLDMSYAEDPENIFVVLEYDEEAADFAATVQ